jgi:putative ABC transport system permease protein
VVFQFVISIALMASTAIVYHQLDYLKNKDLGFHGEQVVVLPIGHSEALSSRVDAIKQELAQHPNIVSISASHSIPSYWLNGFGYVPEGAAPEGRVTLGDVSVDHAFIETYGVELLAGRSFARDLASDSTAFVLNESAAEALGWAADEAVGRQIQWLFPNLGARCNSAHRLSHQPLRVQLYLGAHPPGGSRDDPRAARTDLAPL